MIQSEKKYHLIFNTTDIAILIWDVEKSILVDVNEAMLTMFGYETKAEVVGSGIHQLSANPQDHNINKLKQVSIKSNDKNPILLEWLARKKNGDFFWVEVSLKRVMIEGEDNIIAAIRDIAKRKKIEQDLEERDVILNTIFSKSTDGILLIKNNKYIDCNDAVINLLKLDTRDDIIGKYPWEISPEYQPDGLKSRDKATEMFNQCIDKGTYQFDWLHLKKNNESILFDVVLTLLTINKTQVIHCVIKDITEKHQVQVALTESEEILNSILINIPSIIYRCLLDKDWTMKIISPQIEIVSGYPASDFIENSKRSYASIIHPEDVSFVEETILQQLEEGNTFTLEYRIIDTENEIHWVSEKGIALYSEIDKIKYLDGVINDITERKKIEFELEKHRNNLERLIGERTNELETINEELKSTNEELYNKNGIIADQNEELKSVNEELYIKNEIIARKNTELSQTLDYLKETQSQLLQVEKMASLGILTAGVAHEINNPLNFILGGYVGLENYFQENKLSDQHVSILLNSIKTGVDRISGIVKSLNQFSREKDTYDEDCDIHSIIDNCLIMLQSEIKNRIHVIKQYTDDFYLVKGNVGKLHQVFLNVLTNSCQAIKNEGTITINTKISHFNIIIEILDTGEGINEDNLSRITDPFFTTKNPGEGTGLGLSISYSIIKEHKGTLEFKSEIKKGTKVKITLPIHYE